MRDMRYVLIAMVVLAWVGCAAWLCGAFMAKEPQVEIQYRYLDPRDKNKPENWLRAYEIPAKYYVWDDEVGRYREVTKAVYDQAPR